MTKKEPFYNKYLERRALKPFKIRNKIFYTIIDILSGHIENKGYSVIITPIAFVVEESGEKYVIYLNNEDIDENELFSMIASK